MEQIFDLDTEVPLPKDLLVGITYNLKKGIHKEAVDSEAEYDSIDTVHAIQKALERAGAKVILLEADENLPDKLRNNTPDIVFNIAEGTNGRGREAQVPAILNLYNIPFTGSDETTLCLALDKALTKRLLLTYHIQTPNYRVISPLGKQAPIRLHYPVIIKPNAEGSSKGVSDVSIVENVKELHKLVNHNLALYQQDMLAEEYIEGREFTVGVIGNGEDIHVFTPMEIAYNCSTQGNYHVYSYNVKQDYKKFISYHCPSDIDAKTEQAMMDAARTIYTVLGCKDFSRIDFRVSEDGKAYFIEINPLPGLAPNYSDFPMLAEFCGVPYDTTVVSVLKAALKRYEKSGRRIKEGEAHGQMR